MKQTLPAIFVLLLRILIQAEPETLTLKNSVFGPGEKLIFEAKYGFITGGFGKLEVLDTVRLNGRLCHQIRAVAHSNSTLSLFFPIRDTNISFVDVQGLYSHEIVKIINEGRYKRYRTTDFNQDSLYAHTIDHTIKKDSIIKIVPGIHDVISAFYFFRTLNISDSVDINCLDDYKAYPLRVKILGKETIKTPLGKFSCIEVEPLLSSSGIFLKKGRMSIWLTDDERRLPVMVKFKLPFLGNITCYLTDYNPPEIIPQDSENIATPKPQMESED